MFKYFLDLTKNLEVSTWRKNEIITQIDVIGVQSVPIILFSISFAAAVTILEYSYHMKLVVQTDTLVPGFAALLILRELGAVLSALLLTSRVGAGMAAELGLMKITEQLEALKLLKVDPMAYLVVPRFLATVLSAMVLCIFADATCLLFSSIISVHRLGFSSGSFLSALNHFASFKDFLLSILKAMVFGAVIPVVSCYYGLHCEPGAQGVGKASTQAVVVNAVAIIILDFILTWLFSYLY